jgi:perosamine synthetase
LTALGVGPGDEVIVPVSTFGATANAVIHAGAIPVFVDIDEDTWCIDTTLIEEAITPATRAIIPVHLYGNLADMDMIESIAQKHSLFIVEDCAESLGARFPDSTLNGTKSDVSCFSFFSNKVITTGEGGMVLTRNAELHIKMKQLRDHGTSLERRYWHDYPGFNYRMTNIQAAIGLAQMERIDDFLAIRSKIADNYTKYLSLLPGLRMQVVKPGYSAINWLFTIGVTSEFPCSRDELIEALKEKNIDSRPFFPALFHQPAYVQYMRKSDFPVGLCMEQEGISLPTSNSLSLEEVDRICEAVISFL